MFHRVDISVAVAGYGMAMPYPSSSVALADIPYPTWRASAIGIYRLGFIFPDAETILDLILLNTGKIVQNNNEHT